MIARRSLLASALAAPAIAPRETFAMVVEQEAPGLCVGRVPLDDGTTPFGVLIEPWRVEGRTEITRYGGWRAYVEAKGIPQDR